MTHYPIRGHRVVSERKLTYNNKKGPGLTIIPKGMHGTVICSAVLKSRGRRRVRFDNGMTVDVATKHLLRPGILDRIATAIAND